MPILNALFGYKTISLNNISNLVLETLSRKPVLEKFLNEDRLVIHLFTTIIENKESLYSYKFNGDFSKKDNLVNIYRL